MSKSSFVCKDLWFLPEFGKFGKDLWFLPEFGKFGKMELCAKQNLIAFFQTIGLVESFFAPGGNDKSTWMSLKKWLKPRGYKGRWQRAGTVAIKK